MKKSKLFSPIAALALLLTPIISYSQAPSLGTASNFVLFTSNGAVTSSGTTQLTGKVGTNNGSNIGFGNVNGAMHAVDATTAQCSVDVLAAYNELNTTTPGFFPAPLLGNGQVLGSGVYEITGAATLNLDLTLDAQGDNSAVFIFLIDGPFAANSNSQVNLINGAQACNVFWKAEGLVDMAAGTTMRGTIIANNADINMSVGDTLEGRALTTTGAITVNGTMAYTPTGCGSPMLTGPTPPSLGMCDCFGIFAANGPATNSGVTNIEGDVGSNFGVTTGYNPLLVTGTIRTTPDAVTATAANDLLVAYNYVGALSSDIELLYPTQFGGNLVLTPHTYALNASTTFTDSLYLDAQGNADAVFVIKVYGALETSAYSEVHLINGAQSKNVYWMVNGVVDINEYSTFNGTIISQGAINISTGVTLNGRALSSVGTMETTSMNGNAEMAPASCKTASVQSFEDSKETIAIYPNPFQNQIIIEINDASSLNQSEIIIYNVLGVEMVSETISHHSTTIDTSNFPSGMYFYKVTNSDKTVHSGKMITQE